MKKFLVIIGELIGMVGIVAMFAMLWIGTP